MLWLALHFPDLPLEVFTRASADDAPSVVADGRGREQRVLIADAVAARGGVHRGMALSAAQALLQDLCVHPRDAHAEQTALNHLAAWAGQFTPLVSLIEPSPSEPAPTPTAALLLEVQGSLGLFGGMQALRERVHEGLAQLGYRAHSAIAPTPLSALWLARSGSGTTVTGVAQLPAALFPLPLECLDLSLAQRELLNGLGIRSFGECLRLPRDGLARRLGAETLAAFDRALGARPDPRAPYVPSPHFESLIALPSAVETVEAVLFPLNRLLTELGGFLRARGAGVQRLTLSLRYGRAGVEAIDMTLVAPTRDEKYLALLWRERLARVSLAHPVEAIALMSRELRALGHIEQDFFTTVQAPSEARAALIERLSARLGEAAVQGLALVAEHRPERAWRYIAPGTQTAGAVVMTERPLWLFDAPVPLECRDGAPYLDGRLFLQPDRERIESGWWDGGDIRRDYFIARNDDGIRLWVFREVTGEQRWFIHGVFG